MNLIIDRKNKKIPAISSLTLQGNVYTSLLNIYLPNYIQLNKLLHTEIVRNWIVNLECREISAKDTLVVTWQS